MKENLDIFISHFGQDVVFENGGTLHEIRAIFDNAFYDASIGEIVLDTTQPRLTCKLEDIRGIKRGDYVNIEEKKFSVLQIQPDGTGMATALLAHERNFH